MKKTLTLIALIGAALTACAEGNLKISIFGDSYSTYEGYLTPDTNEIWYFKPENPQLHKNNDVRTVEETWWHQVISNMKAELEVNNAFSRLHNLPYWLSQRTRTKCSDSRIGETP